MQIVKDLVPTSEGNMYRYAKCYSNGVETGEYIYLKYAPGALAQTPTPINAALLEDMYGYSNEEIKVVNGAVVKTCGNVTETTTISNEGVITTVKTDGVKTITVTMSVDENGVITKVVN